MIKQSFTLSVTMLILSFLCPAFLNAQIVTDKRMFSFEEPQLPACITDNCVFRCLSTGNLTVYLTGNHHIST